MNLLRYKLYLLSCLFFISSCDNPSSDKTINQEVKNLVAFSKIYGHIKYFHPSDETRQIDWDKLAILGAEKIKNAKSDTELKQALDSLFIPIAPTLTISETKPDSSVFLSDYIAGIKSDTTNLNTVAWQHLGVDLEQSAPVYASGRINRKDKVWNSNFSLFQSVDAQEFDNSTVQLRAMVKTEVEGDRNEGEIYLRLRDQENRVIAVKNETDEPITSDEWKEYTVKADISNKADQITAGIKLKGEGKLWVDDLELKILDDENQPVSNKLENRGFEKQVRGRPIGWQSTVTGSYDFKTVSNESYKEDYSFYVASDESDSPKPLFEDHTQVGETATQKISDGLWSQVPLAVYSNEGKTLPESPEEDLNRLKSQLSSIELDFMSAEDQNLRLANVIIAWNELQHFYPYFDVIDTNWEEQISISLKKALADDSQKDFYATLRSMFASIQDGHIRLYHPSISNQAGLPFLVDRIDNKVVVTHSLHEKIQPGDIVRSLDGESATEIIQDQQNQISGSSQLSRFRSLRQLGAGESGTEITVEIEGEEDVESYTTQRSSRRSNSKIEKKHLPVTGQIEDNIYYVDLNRASMDRINDEMDQISSSPGVIFDLRGYPNSNHQVIRHLLASQDTSDQWMKIPKIIYPEQKNIVGYQTHGWNLTPAKPHIEGNVVFITDARAISYAESFMSFIEHYNLGEIVGQPTAGTNGNVNSTILPGGFRFGWTGMKVVKHDGSQHHLIGIQPTIPVEKTIQGVREGKDEFLERAIQVLQEEDS